MMWEIRTGGNTTPVVLPTGPKKRASVLPRALGLLFVGMMALLVGVIAAKLNGIVGGKGITPLIASMTNPCGQFPNKDRIHILLIGKDYNFIQSRDPKLNGMPSSKHSRSDSIIYATLDLQRRRVSLLSIPRDTYVSERVMMDGQRILVHKINGTYIEGPERLSEAIQNRYRLPKPDYYVEVKIPGVQKIVDTLGGVEVETIDAMQYHDHWGGLHVDLPKGRQIINGKQAIGFARFREADIYERNEDGSPKLDRLNRPIRKRSRDIVHSKEEGDPRRMARQQQLIRAMINRVKSIDNLFQVDKIVNVGLEQVDTNLDRMQIFALAALFRSLTPEEIEAGTMIGEGKIIQGTWYFVPNEEKCQAMVDWLVKGDKEAANRVTSVAVLNTTGRRGIAGAVAEELKKAQFDIRTVGNAENKEELPEELPLAQTRIIYTKAANRPRAELIQAMIGGIITKDLGPDTTGTLLSREQKPDITVLVGTDQVRATHKPAEKNASKPRG